MSRAASKIPLWLDCDPGHDDAFAILLASYHDKFELLGVSTVYGNAPLSKTTNNALSILQAIGRNDVHVHVGRSQPICREIAHAPDIHGESGLDGTDLLPQPDRLPLMACNTLKDMRDALMSCGAKTAWLVATGPLTNIALMFAVFPEVASHLAGLSIMGGAIGNDFTHVYMGPAYTDATGQTHARIGNRTPFAEFNIWCDPEATKSIFANPDLTGKTILVSLDLTHQACATQEVRDILLHSREKREHPTRLRQMFYELLMFFAKTYEEVFGLVNGPPLHDPLAVAVLLADQIPFNDNGGERWTVNIVTEGEQVGRTEVVPAEDGHGVLIPRSLDVAKFWDVVEDCLGKADKATDDLVEHESLAIRASV